MSLIDCATELSQLKDHELDQVSGGHDKHTVEASCELDDDGNGKCVFKMD